MSPQSKHEMKDVRMTGKQKGLTEIRSPREEERRRRQTKLLEWSVCPGDTHFLKMDDCLEMVSRETTDREGIKSRAADWPGEDCQASESNADLRPDQTPVSPGTRPEAQPVALKHQGSSRVCLLTCL